MLEVYEYFKRYSNFLLKFCNPKYMENFNRKKSVDNCRDNDRVREAGKL